MNKKNTKKSTWKFYLVLAAFGVLTMTGCDGCIQLTGCNISLPGGTPGQSTQSLEQIISDLGQ